MHEPSLGVVLQYPDVAELSDSVVTSRTVTIPAKAQTGSRIAGGASAVSIGVIGSGNYATGVLIPAFKAAGAKLRTVASIMGVSGVHAGRKFGFDETTTESATLFADTALHAVVITTRHDTHAALLVKALHAGKHAFVEKPLALQLDEIATINFAREAAATKGKMPLVMVGFNRRFAPHVVKMKELLSAQASPKAMVMTVNAGSLPAEHWTQDKEVGGGRIVGEVCHFIDLLRHLAAAPITTRYLKAMTSLNGDTVSITLGFADGSTGTVHYFANGNRSVPKERLEVFTGGRILQLDNFRKLVGYGWQGFNKCSLWRQDKGQQACVAAFLDAIMNDKAAPIPFDELTEIARVTIELAQGA